jgi:hypothetical protein
MESKHTSKKSLAQLNRLTAAAAHVSQARLLVMQERRVTLDATTARLLGLMAESLEACVSRLGGIRRTTDGSTKSIPVEFALREVATEVAI